MNKHTELSPPRSKELRNCHPLYRRLSGESVWVFLEELGLSEPQCEAFMDVFFRQMKSILSMMDVMENHPEYMGIIDGQPLDGCTCEHRAGCRVAWPRAVPGHPLPPYAIGCPLRVRVVSGDTAHLLPQEHGDVADGQASFAGQPGAMLCPVLAASPHEALSRYLALAPGFSADEKN